MSDEIDDTLERLEQGVRDEEAGPVLEAARALRQRVRTLLEGTRFEVEDPLLAKRRRLHHRLEVLEAKARTGRFEDAEEDLQAVTSLAQTLAAELAARERAPEDEGAAGGLAGPLLVARREARAVLAGVPGLAVAGTSLLVFGLALSSTGAGRADLADVWRSARAPVGLLAPLAGLLVGLDRLSGDVREGRLHLLAGHGASRASLLVAKALGTLVALLVALLGPGLLVAALALLLGAGTGGLSANLGFLAGVLLAATSFAAIAMLIEALGRDRGDAMALGVAAFLVLGPVWRAAFLSGSGEGAPAAADLGAVMVYRASPIASTRRVLEASLGADPTGALPGLAVLAAWTIAPTLAAAILVQRRGFPRPTSKHN